jgi:hypothetical protein
MKKFLIAVVFAPAFAHAESMWAKDCVRWWGGDIPKAERTKENCPTGSNHWDHSGTGPGTITTQSGVIITNNSTYVVNRVGNTVSVIQSGKR